jgi:hypothetical protein
VVEEPKIAEPGCGGHVDKSRQYVGLVIGVRVAIQDGIHLGAVEPNHREVEINVQKGKLLQQQHFVPGSQQRQLVVRNDEGAFFHLAEMTEPYDRHQCDSESERGFDPTVAGQDAVFIVHNARHHKAEHVDVPCNVGYLLLAMSSGVRGVRLKLFGRHIFDLQAR